MGVLEGSIESLVDRVVESHRAVVGTLDEDVGELSGGMSRALRRDARRSSVRTLELPSQKEVLERHLAPFRQQRRERTLLSEQLRPVEGPVPLDAPLVTRAGVIYVPPDFEQAQGLDGESAARLVRAGYRSVEAFLQAPVEELAVVANRPASMLRRARGDLDLMRLPILDSKAADLLRLAGCATVSRLAAMDPVLLVRDLERIKSRYRFVDLPAALDGERAVRRVVSAAQARFE